jgi:hypothetical protein
VLRNIFVAAKVFAFLNLVFVPSIAVLLAVACTGSGPWWFTFLGLPALVTNFFVVFSNPLRRRIWNKISAIAGQSHLASRKG